MRYVLIQPPNDYGILKAGYLYQAVLHADGERARGIYRPDAMIIDKKQQQVTNMPEPEKIYLRWVAETNSRVTHGRWYTATLTASPSSKYPYSIQDDRGEDLRPAIDSHAHWELRLPCPKEDLYLTEEEPKAMKIENVILINDRRANTYTDDQILEFVKQQEAMVESLEKIKTESQAVKKLKAKHQTNINKLLAILDARTTEEAV